MEAISRSARPVNRMQQAWTSTFNMTQLDLLRMDQILHHIDESYFQCSQLSFKALMPYLFSLKSLYHYMRPLTHESVRLRFDKDFLEMEKLLMRELKFTWNTLGQIEILHNNMMDLRQMLNLGTATKRYVNDRKYLKPEFGGEEQDGVSP